MPFDPLSPPQPEQTPPPRWDRPTWALPSWARMPRMSRLPRAGLTFGLAAGLALGGAGIAFAASSATSSSPSLAASSGSTSTTLPGGLPKRPHFPGGPMGPFGRLGGLGLGRGLGGVVHGQVTVPNGNGGYRTIEMQVGTVTSVSSSSIALKSADGYQHAYTVVSSTVVDSQAGGISAVAKGDEVRVIASIQSGKDTALSVVDTTKIGSSWKGFGFGARPGTAPGPDPGPAPQA